MSYQVFQNNKDSTTAATIDAAVTNSGQQHELQWNQGSIVHLLDRVANFEAMLVAFIAEKNLSFSISGKK